MRAAGCGGDGDRVYTDWSRGEDWSRLPSCTEGAVERIPTALQGSAARAPGWHSCQESRRSGGGGGMPPVRPHSATGHPARATPLFVAPGKYISRQGRDKRGTMAPDFPRGPEGTDQDPASPHPAAGWASSHSSRWRARAVTALLPVGRGDAPAMLGGDAVKARPKGKGGERGRWVCSTCGAPPDGFVLHDQNSRAT